MSFVVECWLAVDLGLLFLCFYLIIVYLNVFKIVDLVLDPRCAYWFPGLHVLMDKTFKLLLTFLQPAS